LELATHRDLEIPNPRLVVHLGKPPKIQDVLDRRLVSSMAGTKAPDNVGHLGLLAAVANIGARIAGKSDTALLLINVGAIVAVAVAAVQVRPKVEALNIGGAGFVEVVIPGAVSFDEGVEVGPGGEVLSGLPGVWKLQKCKKRRRGSCLEKRERVE